MIPRKREAIAVLIAVLCGGGCFQDDPEGEEDGGALADAGDAGGGADGGEVDGGDAGDSGGGEADAAQLWGTEEHPLPEDALLVTAEELETFRASGELIPYHPGDDEAQQTEHEEQQREDEAEVEAFIAANPELAERLREPAVSSEAVRRADGDYEVGFVNNEGEEQRVVTFGGKTRASIIASMLRRGGSLENQKKIYYSVYAMSPPECLDGMPDPQELDGATAEELLAASEAMGACWADFVQSSGLVAGASQEFPPDRPATPDGYDGAPGEATNDHTGDSTGNNNCFHHPSGLYDQMSWVGQAYDSPIKNQARRGTCVAFGIVGAMENMRARLGDWVDLSEQYLYKLGRLESPWGRPEPGDGLPTADFVDYLQQTGAMVPYEQKWVYNPSPWRVTCGAWQDPDEPMPCQRGQDDWGWRMSCRQPGPSGIEYQGPACSNTAHQAELLCTDPNTGQPLYSCFWWTPSFSEGRRIADSIEWMNADCLHSNACFNYVSQALWAGWSAVVSVDVYQNFMDTPATGRPGPGSLLEYLGGHAMHLSGWVFNHELPAGYPPSSGAGYFVVRNSWGGCWGDAGYGYVSDVWMIDHVNSIVAIKAHVAGYNTHPTVDITSPASGSSHSYGGLLGGIPFTAVADDTEDGPEGCRVTWYKDFGVYVGEGTEIEIPFDTTGTHYVMAQAEDTEFGKNYDVITIDLTNDAPNAEILTPEEGDEVIVGAVVPLNGQGYDMNVPVFPCDGLEWTSSVRGDSSGGDFPVTGCNAEVTFTTAGPRTITLTASDDMGATGTDSVNITVVDPLPHSPPQVTITNPAAGTAHAPGATISLTAQVIDPDGQIVLDRRWTAQRTTGAEVDVGTLNMQPWSYLDTFPCGCGTEEVTVRHYATDVDGTGSDEVTFAVMCPPC